jgi:hypothetical protein
MLVGVDHVESRPNAAAGLRPLPTKQGPRGMGLTYARRGSRHRHVRAIVVLAGRATHVPQAAVTSGIQRTVTVTPRESLGWAHAPGLRRRGGAKLHGMQGVRGSNPLSSTAKYQGKRSAGATPAGRRTPAKPHFGTLAANTGRHQAI